MRMTLCEPPDCLRAAPEFVSQRDATAFYLVEYDRGGRWHTMRTTGFLYLLAIAVPAHAAGSAISEPSTLALFGLGVLGVIVGRQGSRRNRD